MTKELTLRVVLAAPPAGVDFGIQKGRGTPKYSPTKRTLAGGESLHATRPPRPLSASYETIQKQRSNGGDLSFEYTVALKESKDPTMPDFTGPLVHGPVGERFLYINIGESAGQKDTCWNRRLKIPLRDITWKMAAQPLQARVPGTAKDGGPNCATVKPFDGWK